MKSLHPKIFFDAENQLTEVKRNSTSIATFVYDGDGKRVKGTVGSTTTAYIGNTYEWTDSTDTMVKYYYAGSDRVAMRVGSSSLRWLLSDHLGSTTVVADSSGGLVSKLLYKAWGELRYASGTTLTTHRYTGQQQSAGMGDADGLYYYGARWYDPYLNRWTSPDTIIPDPYNSLDIDRYAYARNNPISNSDPTGHFTEDQIKKFMGFSEDDPWKKVLRLFEKGGKYEGRWGWLEVLKKAEIGDQITIEWVNGFLPKDHPALSGKLELALSPQGDLILVGDNYFFDHEVAGRFGREYELLHYTPNTGKKVGAAFLILVTDLGIGVPSFCLILSGEPVSMKTGEFLETFVVLPINILGIKMWNDADREKYEVLTIQAIPSPSKPR